MAAVSILATFEFASIYEAYIHWSVRYHNVVVIAVLTITQGGHRLV